MPLKLLEQYQMPELLPRFDFEGIPSPDKINNNFIQPIQNKATNVSIYLSLLTFWKKS